MNPIAWLLLEILAGAGVFGLALPWLYRQMRHTPPPGSLPDSDEIPWWSHAVSYLCIWLAVYYPMLQMFKLTSNSLNPVLWVSIVAYWQLVITVPPALARRPFGRTVLDTDPWFEPIERLRTAAGVPQFRFRIVRSKQTQPTVNLLGEIELPSFLLRIATPEEVAILCAPAILQRTFRWRRPRWWIANPNVIAREHEVRSEADRLAQRVFADPEALHRAFVRQGSSAAEAEARVAMLGQGGRP